MKQFDDKNLPLKTELVVSFLIYWWRKLYGVFTDRKFTTYKIQNFLHLPHNSRMRERNLKKQIYAVAKLSNSTPEEVLRDGTASVFMYYKQFEKHYNSMMYLLIDKCREFEIPDDKIIHVEEFDINLDFTLPRDDDEALAAPEELLAIELPDYLQGLEEEPLDFEDAPPEYQRVLGDAPQRRLIGYVPPIDHDPPGDDGEPQAQLDDNAARVEEDEMHVLSALVENQNRISEARMEEMNDHVAQTTAQREKFTEIMNLFRETATSHTRFDIFVSAIRYVYSEIDRAINEMLPMDSDRFTMYFQDVWNYLIKAWGDFAFKTSEYRSKYASLVESVKRGKINRLIKDLKITEQDQDAFRAAYDRYQDQWERLLKDMSNILTRWHIDHNNTLIVMPPTSSTRSHMEILYALHKLADIMSQAVY